MCQLFNSSNTEAALFVDGSNAFNLLNRQVLLQNIQHLCPSLASALHTIKRVRDVEMSCFSSLVFSGAGGCGVTANVILKRLASCTATYQGKSYSPTLCWLCCHNGFSLVHSAVLCLRGCRSSPGHLPDLSMIDLAVHEEQLHEH